MYLPSLILIFAFAVSIPTKSECLPAEQSPDPSMPCPFIPRDPEDPEILKKANIALAQVDADVDVPCRRIATEIEEVKSQVVAGVRYNIEAIVCVPDDAGCKSPQKDAGKCKTCEFDLLDQPQLKRLDVISIYCEWMLNGQSIAETEMTFALYIRLPELV